MLALEYDPELAKQAWIEKGIEQGIEQGIEKVAKKLLSMNLPISDIVKATGCTEEKILSLAETERGVGTDVNCRIHL